MRHYEIGIDNQELSWREHLFSEMISEPELSLEPIFNNHGKSFFTIVPDSEVNWNWSDWEYAEKILHYGGSKAKNFDVVKHHETPSAFLYDLTGAETLEIIFRGEQEQTGAVKQRFTDKIYEKHIKFEMQNEGVVVKIGGELSTENLFIERYELHGTQNLRWVDTSKFYKAQYLIPKEPYAEYLVVIKHIGRRRKLLKCITFIPNELIRTSRDERKKLKAIVEGTQNNYRTGASETKSWEEWIENWSHISREKFLKLVDLACRNLNLEKQEACEMVQHYPTGLNRALVLHFLGCPYIATKWWSIKSLNDGDFVTAVGNLKKGFAAMLAAMPTLEEKLWLIIEAENDCLGQAVKNVENLKLPTLRRELHLLVMRREAVRAREARKNVN